MGFSGGSGSGLVGFAGSRSLSSSWAPLVSSVVSSVLASGRRVAVGCCRGADQLVLSSVPASALSRVWVFAAFASSGAGSVPAVSAVSAVSAAAAGGAGVSWLAGGPLSLPARVRLAARSAFLVRALAASRGFSGPGSALFLFLASPSSRGSLRAARLAASLGVPVSAFCCGFSGPPPSLGSGSWSFVGLVSGAGRWRWVPASEAQLPLFAEEV